MHLKTRVLDKYFLDQITKKGIKASQKEVTKFFDENGWRLYDFDRMIKRFNNWKSLSTK